MFVLSDDSQRTSGEDAQTSNITAGKAVSEAVRTTLGPRGMDKMLVSDSGDVVITNDGATILQEMDIEHPAAQMIVEVAETQEAEVGDGTTTASVLAGQLLAKAETLLEEDMHPTGIVEGYNEAARLAAEAIDEMVIDGDTDDELLRQVAETSMTGKGTGGLTPESLAEVVVDAIRAVESDDGIDRESVRVRTQVGASAAATELIEGVIVEDEPVREDMPTSVEDATIGVFDVDFDIREANIDAEYDITDIDQLNAAIDAEEGELASYAQTLSEAGVDVAVVTNDIDDRAAAYLAEEGILAFDSVSDDDAGAIARATGATQVGSLTDLDESDFGHAENVSIDTFGEDDLLFVEGGEATDSVTVFVRGGTEHLIDELERAIDDALDVVTASIETGGVVPGAGASEIAMASYIRDRAASIEGRRQLAVEAFADAMDVLPRTLGSNVGMDPIDALVELRSRHDGEGRAGVIAEGQTGVIDDPVEYGVYDPAQVKYEAIESATEAATMIARIDDVISAD
jgi:archaeal chaperonin